MPYDLESQTYTPYHHRGIRGVKFGGRTLYSALRAVPDSVFQAYHHRGNPSLKKSMAPYKHRLEEAIDHGRSKRRNYLGGSQSSAHGSPTMRSFARNLLGRNHSGLRVNTTGTHRRAGGSVRVSGLRGSGGAERALSARDPYVKKGKRVKGVKGNKLVKVSKSFRKKVTQVEKGILPLGTLHRTFGCCSVTIGSPAGKDQVITFAQMADGTNANAFQFLFTLDQYLDAASILFNQKLLHSNTLHLVPGYSGNFVFNTVKFDVVDSKFMLKITNPSNRKLTLKIYDCYPKCRSSVDIGNAGLQTAWDYTGTALGAGLDQEGYYGAPQSIPPSFSTDCENVAYPGAVNGVVYSDVAYANDFIPLHSSPFDLPTMRKMWKHDFKEVVLEGFQSIEHVIQGPKNFTYNGSKHFKNNLWMNFQKFSCSPMITVTLDQVMSSTDLTAFSSTGRFPNKKAIDQQLLFEGQLIYKVRMPEQTGGQSILQNMGGAVGLGVTGNTAINRHPVYIRSTGLGLSSGAHVVDGSDLNPAIAPYDG